MPTFFRRRQVWLPTAWFAALLLAVAVLLLTLAASGLAEFLSVQAPARGADGQGARALVVEGWLEPADLDAAAATIRAGRYERIYTSGGPIESFGEHQPWPTYAERAAAYLQTLDLGGRPVVAVPAPRTRQDRTWLSARRVRAALQREAAAPQALDIYSSGVHARRTRAVYRLAFGRDVEIGTLAAPALDYDPRGWWRSSAGVKAVLGETLSLAWTTCCFWPTAPEASMADGTRRSPGDHASGAPAGEPRRAGEARPLRP